MSAPRFTPGPWDALPKADYVHVAGKGHVAKITNPWNDAAERQANAHLIAAAPDGYSLGEWIAEHWADPSISHEDFRCEVSRRAGAFLAKARGEQ